MDKFKVSLYIRVSTNKQATKGESLEEQEKELKKFCEYKKYLIHKTHIERGRSAKDTNRPEYQKLLADVKSKKINAVVVKKLDRLSRSLIDFEEFMKTAQTNEVEFISLKENFDTTNAMGKAMLRVALVFAQLEREQSSERISDVMNYLAEKGLYPGGGRPQGYDIIDKQLIVHKKEKQTIQFIFDKFIETKSTTLVAKELNSLGLHTRNGRIWDTRKVDKILKTPVYTGKIKWAGKIYTGVHQPIITETKFNRVQEIFQSRLFVSPRDKIKGLLRGILFCGHCGGSMSPNYARKKKTGKLYHYYRCLSGQHMKQPRTQGCREYVSYEQAHKIVLEKILDYASEEKLNQIYKKISTHNRQLEKDIKAFEVELNCLEASLKNIKQKREKYLDSLISGSFSDQERKKINDKIDEYALEEKQTQSAIYHQQFGISEKNDQLISIEAFKQNIIQFKFNHKRMIEDELTQWVKAHIQEISYSKDEIKIIFKDLKMGS